jgi:hypothetical protein
MVMTGIFAVWSRNGRELFYRTPDQQIMVVSYTTEGDSFVPDKPRLWSEKRLADTGNLQNLDISPDGKRFLVLMPAETPAEPVFTQPSCELHGMPKTQNGDTRF